MGKCNKNFRKRNKRRRNTLKYVLIPLSMTAILHFTTGCGITDEILPVSFSGEGTRWEPYVLDGSESFMDFAESISKGNEYEGVYFVMADDIDLSGSNYSQFFSSDAMTFSGILDGCGHSIKGLNIKGDSSAGLFSRLEGIVVNLTVESGEIYAEDTAGAIAAVIGDKGSVVNCCNYATVDAADAGGISGLCRGKIINCVSMVDKDADGAKDLTAKKKKSFIENSYVNRQASFKVTCNGTDENNERLRNRSAENLNNRIFDLSKTNDGIDFCYWEVLPEFPYLRLTDEKADVVKMIRVTAPNGNESNLKYGKKRHGFEEKDEKTGFLTEGSTVYYTTASGKEKSFKIAETTDSLYFKEGRVRYAIYPENPKNIKLKKAKEKIFIDFDDLSDIPKCCRAYKQSYYDENGALADTETVFMVSGKGEYSFRGNLDGCIYSDISENENEGLIFNLDGVKIDSAYAPAILARDGEKADGNPGLDVRIPDGSINELSGASYLDMFSADVKYDGVISSEHSINLFGDTGHLVLKGMSEGVESDTDVYVHGGNYEIECQDDAFSAATYNQLAGNVFITCFDNGIDCDNVHINGGILTGQNMLKSECFMKSNVRLMGGKVVYAGAHKGILPYSSEELLELEPGETLLKDSLLLLKKGEEPVCGIRLYADADELGFSIPKGDDKGEYSLVRCDSIEGEFDDMLCENVISYVESAK